MCIQHIKLNCGHEYTQKPLGERNHSKAQPFMYFIHHHPSLCCYYITHPPSFVCSHPFIVSQPNFNRLIHACSPSAALTLTLLFTVPFDDVTRHVCTCEGPETIQLFVYVCLGTGETGPYCQGCWGTVIVQRHYR